MSNPLKDNICLEVDDLTTNFYTYRGIVKAVRGISFYVDKGEMLGIVGESGSGKSVTAFSVLNLVKHPGKIDSGKILFNGIDLLSLPKEVMRKLRSEKISMIFQEPLSALNPAFTIGWQVGEVFKLQGVKSKKEIEERTIHILEKVKLPDPRQRMKEYSYQFSGGMRQRALIAISLACSPELVFADEPTTALDVTVQAEILDLLQGLQKEFGMSVVFISHNLNLVGERCKRIIVMYGGKIVETAPTMELFNNPCHPYTQGLLASMPNVMEKGHIYSIPGEIPDMLSDINGCCFAPRCSKAREICFCKEPPLTEISDAHTCNCFLYKGGA